MPTSIAWLPFCLILLSSMQDVSAGKLRRAPLSLQVAATGALPPSTAKPGTPNPKYLAYAHGAITYLQSFYSPDGLWPPAGWWNSANALTLLLDLRAADSSSNLTSITDGPTGVFQTTLHKAPPDLSKGFLYDNYLDDEGWWILALIKGYDVTHDSAFLTAANLTFADIAANGLTDVPCGGVWWDKPPEVNRADAVITTALFINAAALLATRLPSQQAYFLNLALPQWTWLTSPALLKDHIIKGDALHPPTCTSNNATLSYQMGVTIGAGVALTTATGNSSYLALATNMANALMIPSDPLTDANSILFDPYTTFGPDTAQFKGILMRNLAILYEETRDGRIVEFLRLNADSIWARDRSGDGRDQFGGKWAGGWDTGSDGGTAMAAHISGTMALVAAAVVG